jgi:hypothetical protein
MDKHKNRMNGMNEKQLHALYIAQLPPREKKTLDIAIEHLQTSFSLEKSIGYETWFKEYKKTFTPTATSCVSGGSHNVILTPSGD